MDWDEIINTVFYGYAQRLKTPFGVFMKRQDPSTWPYTYDVEKAQEHLKKSSCPDGCDIDMYIAEYIGADEKMAVMIKDYLAQLGINMNIQKQTGVENWDSKIAKKLPFYLMEFYSWVPDAGYHILLVDISYFYLDPRIKGA